MTVRLDSIRECFEGVIPGHIATCDPDGVPNLAYLSQVQYIDNEHVALSYQFFNRTRQNVLADSPVRLLLTSHLTGTQYRLKLRYLHTEQSGALFEQMKAKLAGIAAHSGMSNVFQLLGSDIYRVLAIEQVPGSAPPLPPPAPQINHLSALRTALHRLATCTQFECLLDTALDSLQQSFGIQHAMLLMLDESRQRLYTLASLGYPDSGVGAEVPMGSGLIGICARERTPIRIGFMSSEYSYGRAIRDRLAAEGNGDALETAIPMPGLPDAASQMAVPILAMNRLLGVLYVESVADLHFGYEDEDALVAFASQLGLGMLALEEAPDTCPEEAPPSAPTAIETADPNTATVLHVQHYSANDSVFINDDYLIKGVAGAILWALLSDHVERGRTSFTNKALRADPRIPLPGLSDNLEARLVLLQKRLAERHTGITLTKTGRGCFELNVQGALVLTSA